MTTQTSPIPCKRPHVTIEPHLKTFHTGTTGTYHLVTCSVPGCDFTYDAAVVTDAAQQATWHRQAHRAAVPKHSVGGPTVNLNYFAECACGWRSSDGYLTRTDNQAALDHHLSAEHGLVTC